jgi:DNA repair protein RecO (recombination protein O)
MEWRDTGFVLAARRHGESALIAELLTREHGRHAGLVRGGQSPRRRALLQPGNQVTASWRGRLPAKPLHRRRRRQRSVLTFGRQDYLDSCP